MIVGLVQVIEGDHAVSTGSYQTLRLGHELNASDPTRAHIDGLFPLELETEPDLDCTIAR